MDAVGGIADQRQAVGDIGLGQGQPQGIGPARPGGGNGAQMVAEALAQRPVEIRGTEIQQSRHQIAPLGPDDR